MQGAFKDFYGWVWKHCGITLDAYKDAQMQRRLVSIMGKSGARNFKEYAALIEHNDAIRSDFLNHVTINVTEFYRNKEKFQEFEELVTKELAPRFSSLKFWSAACSNGAEPYTVSMLLHDNNLEKRSRIMATDIDATILDRAKEGIYLERDVKNVTPAFRDKYFNQRENRFVLKEDVKRLVLFRQHDLINQDYESGFHAILCRNVTIYFKNQIRDDLYQKFADALVPGGLFFIGATEGIYNPGEFGLKKRTASIYEKI